jgi:hypothetical protein
MDQLTDLPRNIVPEEFFERVLTSLVDLGDIESVIPEHALIRLEGAGGGTWFLAVREGRPVIRPGDTADPVLQITLRVSDWREFVAGRVRDELQRHLSVNLLDPRTLLRILTSEEALALVRDLSGDVQIVVEDDAEHLSYVGTITLGSGAPCIESPTTRVTVELEDAGRIVRGEASPQEAFFTGRIRVDGDMNLAMALVTVVSVLRSAATGDGP